MTLIDVVIILITAVSAGVILGQRRELVAAGALKPTLMLLAGLVFIGVFYVADLWTMHVLPARTSPGAAMQTMEDLHLNWNWLVVVAAVGCICIGLVGIVRNQLALIRSLRSSRAEIQREVVARDVAEAERDALNRRLQQNQRLESLGTLTGGIAHDFNNLLTPILGYTDLLLSGLKGQSESTDRLHQIRIAAERAKGLIQQILAFGGRADTERVVVDAAESVGQALDLVRATLPATVEVRRSLEPGRHISVDPTQLMQVIVNLCTNAAQSMPDGGVLDVRVSMVEIDETSGAVHPELTDGPKVRLTVSDTGSGIPPDESWSRDVGVAGVYRRHRGRSDRCRLPLPTVARLVPGDHHRPHDARYHGPRAHRRSANGQA